MQLERSRANPETRAMISAVVRGCPASKIDAAVRRLCREFQDGHSQGFYVDTLNCVQRGERSTSDLLHAYDRATGINVLRPGAAFVAALKTSA